MDLLLLTRYLCYINSETGLDSYKDIKEACLRHLSSRVSAKRIPSASSKASGDLLISRKGGGMKRLLFLGHYDTVPVSSFKQRLEGDLLYAPGSYDMKGGVAIALQTLDLLDSNDFSEVTLYLAGDEEWRDSPLQIDGVWDAIIAFEGGEEGGAVTSRFGAGVLDISVTGNFLRATHPPSEDSSVYGLSQIILDLSKKNSKDVHFTASRLSASAAINVIPALSSASGVMRYKKESERDRFLRSLPKSRGSLTIDYSFRELIPSLQADEESDRLLEKLDVQPLIRTGSSDIAWLAGQAPIMIDGLGPLGGGEHSKEEHISISSLSSQAALVHKIISLV